MDYRELLKKYIEHVRKTEGTDFILQGTWYGDDNKIFTEGEWQELSALAKDVEIELTHT